MANLKSSKKDAKQSIVRAVRNKMRKTELKTLCKKVFAAVEAKQIELAKALFIETQSKIARDKGKGLLKANTASRKISGLAKRVGSLAGLA
jgi:small subunit ribosomal protein S20